MAPDPSQYVILTQQAGLIELSRTTIESSGKDRLAFLHHLCTNDVASLRAGQGCETFALTAQGKIVGHFFLFVEEDRILLDTTPRQAETLISHFERYLIRENVRLNDLTAETGHCLLAGPASVDVVRQVAGLTLEHDLDHAAYAVGGGVASIRRVDWCGPCGFAIAYSLPHRDELVQSLLAAGGQCCDEYWLDVLRVENKTPWFGADIDQDNLPQEVDRDRQAISFQKGCYLGQETVARIDAMGHVNRRLVGLQFAADEPPAANTELMRDQKVVGRVTTSAFSPALNAPLALGYLRRGVWDVGATVHTAAQISARVITLPPG